MYSYKIKVLNEMLDKMKKQEYYLCKLKGDDTAPINLDEEEISILIEYYSKKK